MQYRPRCDGPSKECGPTVTATSIDTATGTQRVSFPHALNHMWHPYRFVIADQFVMATAGTGTASDMSIRFRIDTLSRVVSRARYDADPALKQHKFYFGTGGRADIAVGVMRLDAILRCAREFPIGGNELDGWPAGTETNPMYYPKHLMSGGFLFHSIGMLGQTHKSPQFPCRVCLFLGVWVRFVRSRGFLSIASGTCID
jgi:hypothetical protein